MKLSPLIGLCSAVPLAWFNAGARAETPITIPAQPLAGALQQLSLQSGINILFVPTLVAPYHARAVQGARNAGEAVRIILSATPLEALPDGSGGLIVRLRPVAAPEPQKAPPPESKPPSASAIPLQPAPPPVQQQQVVTVTARAVSGGTTRQIPNSVIRLLPDQLVQAGANTLSSLTSLTSGLQVASVRTTALTFMRGVGTTLSAPNADPSINITLNGAYVPMEMTASVFFDLERIDVMPGPQGTLSGHNSSGGVIDLITKRPGDRFKADGFVEFGDYGRVQAQLGLDTPITGTLALRTAVSLIRHDGYDSNGGDDQDSKAARVTAVWKPDSDTTTTAVATYSKDGGIGPFNFNVPALYGPYREQGFDPKALGFFIDYRTFTGGIETGHRFNDQTSLTYSGAFDHLQQLTKTEAWSGTPLAILNASQADNTVSQELRLNADTGRFKTVAGLYWFDSAAHYTSAIDNEEIPVSTSNSIGPFRAGNEGEAAYGQTSYAINPSLRIIGGLRYSETGKSIAGQDTTVISNGTASTSSLFPFAGHTSLGHLDWRLMAEWDVSSRSSLYGGVSTGIKPGGFSAIPAGTGQLQAIGFKPATLTAYTAGTKNQLANGRLVLNLEGFWYDYHDYQVSQRDLATNENTVYNATRARVYGTQIDLRANPTPQDRLTLSLSLQQARALSLTTPLGVFDGYQLPFAPDATLYASYRHVFDLASGAHLEMAVNGDWTASRWGTYSHAAGTFVAATHSIDATLTYRVPSGRYAIALWGRNLTNSIIPTQVSVAPAPAGPGQEFLAPPRTYGMRFSFDY